MDWGGRLSSGRVHISARYHSRGRLLQQILITYTCAAVGPTVVGIRRAERLLIQPLRAAVGELAAAF